MSLLRAYEEIVLNELVSFYNMHRIPQDKLEKEMRGRYDRIVKVAADTLVESVGLVVPLDAENAKDTRLPLKDRLHRLETKPLLLEDALSESFV